MMLEIVSFSLESLSMLFLVAVMAGFLDTLAGGGGLISLPALIVSGVPPLAALGTNKLQGCIGTAMATYMMFRNKRVRWNKVKYTMLSAFIGAILGTALVQFINTAILSFVIPVVLLFIAAYFLLAPMPNEDQAKNKLSCATYRSTVVPFIGFYDGMFGPGTGSFFALSGIICRGHNLISSTAVAKPLNFSTNFASLIIFLIAGQVVLVAGLVMMLGQAIGAWLGSHFLFKINPVYLRGVIVLMCVGMLIKYANSMGWINLV